VSHFETNFDWSTTLWTIGLDEEGLVHIWARQQMSTHHLAQALRRVADGLENGNLEQIGPMR
jgi:hypothetical protein